jgi:class 3 adenylate cyclase
MQAGAALRDQRDLRAKPYVPRAMLELLANAPEQRVRQVDGTCVFVDVSGFTKLSERLARRGGREGAEQLTDAIGACFERLLAVAYDKGGGLLKFGGDALLLLFDGAAHTERACAAAVAMSGELRAHGAVPLRAALLTDPIAADDRLVSRFGRSVVPPADAGSGAGRRRRVPSSF